MSTRNERYSFGVVVCWVHRKRNWRTLSFTSRPDVAYKPDVMKSISNNVKNRSYPNQTIFMFFHSHCLKDCGMWYPCLGLAGNVIVGDCVRLPSAFDGPPTCFLSVSVVPPLDSESEWVDVRFRHFRIVWMFPRKDVFLALSLLLGVTTFVLLSEVTTFVVLSGSAMSDVVFLTSKNSFLLACRCKAFGCRSNRCFLATEFILTRVIDNECVSDNNKHSYWMVKSILLTIWS